MKFTLKPVTGEMLVGREKILKELTEELGDVKSNFGFCLYGRRRVGKTSILREVERRFESREKVVVAYLSLYNIADLSVKTFTEELSLAIMEGYRRKGLLPIEFRLKTLAKAPVEMVSEVLEKVKLGAEVLNEIRVFLEFGGRTVTNYSDYLRRAFNLGEMLAEKTDTKCVLMLDEFPEILRVKNGMQIVKMFRTAHEGHKRTVLLISGSIYHTLAAIALDGASPFYKQLIPKSIEPFTPEEVKEFLRVYADSADERISSHLHRSTGGVPFYLQYIGRVARSMEEVDEAVKEFVEEEGNIFFQEEFGKLSEKEKLIMGSMARGLERPTGIARDIAEPVTSVTRFLKLLMDKEVIVKKDKGRYKIADPMFSMWLGTIPY